MPGNIIFRPIEAKFHVDKDSESKKNAYCKFKLGWHSGKTAVAKQEEALAKWSEVVCLERNKDEAFAKLKVKDRSTLGLSRTIGEAKIDLEVVMANKKIQQWYNIYNKEVITGEVLIDIEYCPPL